MKPIRPERKPEDYADLLDLPHPTSQRHPRMSPLARAAQFAPFAALSGYEAMIAESARRAECEAEVPEEPEGFHSSKKNLAEGD